MKRREVVELELICPHCSQKLEAEAEMLGKTIECPSCRGPITLPLFPPRDRSVPPPLPARPQRQLAVVSLILGIASFLLGPVGPLLAIAAVICGGAARRRAGHRPEAETGLCLARAGQTLGYINIILAVIFIATCSAMLG